MFDHADVKVTGTDVQTKKIRKVKKKLKKTDAEKNIPDLTQEKKPVHNPVKKTSNAKWIGLGVLALTGVIVTVYGLKYGFRDNDSSEVLSDDVAPGAVPMRDESGKTWRSRRPND